MYLKIRQLICVLFVALAEQWSSLQGTFLYIFVTKIAIYRGFAVLIAIFKSHYTGDYTNWNRTNWGPPVLKYNRSSTELIEWFRNLVGIFRKYISWNECLIITMFLPCFSVHKAILSTTNISPQASIYVTLKLQNVKSTTVPVKGPQPCWEQDFLL